MFQSTLGEIAAAVRGTVPFGDPSTPIKGVSTDSRAVSAGGLFVALKGERFDGHAFARAVLKGPAAAALVSDRASLPSPDGLTGKCAIHVHNTGEAYLRLGAWHRKRLDTDVRWFAITGSAGKTTVKEMLAHVLGEGAGWKVHRARKSFNNHVGVPATILEVEAAHDAAVLEIGTNHFGEIMMLADVARPQIAVINNAGPVHLEALKTVDGVAEEKSHLLDFQQRHDTAILNADDPHFAYWQARATGKVLAFGENAVAGVRAQKVRAMAEGMYAFQLCHAGQQLPVRLAVPGRHHVHNALAAAAAALAVGVPLRTIASGLETFFGAERRFQMSVCDGARIVDDAYNASPMSFRVALETARLLASESQRLFIVAGDMLELGESAEAHHRALGGLFAAAQPDGLWTVGELAGVAGQAAVHAGLASNRWQACPSPVAAAKLVREQLQPGDVVLVKGSNGMGLDACVKGLTRTPATTPAAGD